MALDFANRDPKDPNGIYSLDTTGAAEAWVKDGDWSQVYYDQASAKKAGATNKIKVATAITNDGKKYDVVIGADGNPISQVGDTKGQDDDVAKKWQQSQAAPTTRTINGVPSQVVGTDANGQPIWGPVQTTNGPATTAPSTAQRQEWREEGTPLPGGGFDNNQLTMAEYINGKRTGVTRAPDDKELRSWNNAREMSRNPGGKTDAEMDAARRQQAADDERRAQQNRPTVTIRDDGNGGLVSISTDPRTGQSTTSPIPGVRGKPDQVTVDGVVYERGKDGTYAPAKGLPGTEAVPAGAPKYTPDYEQDDLGLTAYNDALIEANRQGLITRQQAGKLLKQAGALATQTASHGTTRRNQANTVRGQNIQQRGQDISEVSSRRASANGMFQDVNNTLAPYASKIIPGAGSGQTVVDGYRAMLNMGRQNAEDWGGMRDVSQVPESTLPGGMRMAPGGAVVPAGPPAASAPPSATAQTNGASAVAELTPGSLAPPARPAAAPAAVTPGLERPDDLLDFAADSASPAETMTRAAFDAMTPSQQAYYRSRLINARSGQSAPQPSVPVFKPTPTYADPTITDPAYTQNPGGVVTPVFPSTDNSPPPVLPPNELTLAPGGVFRPQPVAAASGGSSSPGLFNPDDYSGHLAEIGLSPEEAQNVLELYRRGVRAEHL